jgi:predicted RNA polymerase sigma factor
MGRVLTSIAPHEPEAHGLLALMELNASRTAARTGAVGEPILMLDQNHALWDQLQIRRGMQALGRARELGGAVRGDLLHKLGRYEEARAAFEAAAALAGNRREHDLLRRRAAEAADAAISS